MKKHKKNKSQVKRKKPKLTHDSFFKLFYSDTELAKELLKLIFSKKELEAYDLNKLKIEKDTFEARRADLIFSLPFKDYPKKRVKIFIILEHTYRKSNVKNVLSHLQKFFIFFLHYGLQNSLKAPLTLISASPCSLLLSL